MGGRALGGGGAGRAVALALISTVVVLGVVVYGVTHAPNWPEVKASFFDWDVYKSSFPGIAHAFLLNVKIFLIAEAIILFTALALAVLRSLPARSSSRSGRSRSPTPTSSAACRRSS